MGELKTKYQILLEKYEQAEWVAYELKKNELNYSNNNFERPFFIEDPKVESGSADWRNYKKSNWYKYSCINSCN